MRTPKMIKSNHITLFYVLVAAGWILLSDALAPLIFPETAYQALFQILRELAFVGITGMILYFVLKHRHQTVEVTSTLIP